MTFKERLDMDDLEVKFVLNEDVTTYSLVDHNNTTICSSLTAEDKERLEKFFNEINY